MEAQILSFPVQEQASESAHWFKRYEAKQTNSVEPSKMHEIFVYP
jgi:hypothetical protein